MLTDIVRGVFVCVRPSYILAKGGVTSHEVAICGLGMSRARVLGQIESGVPVWEPVKGEKMYEVISFPISN